MNNDFENDACVRMLGDVIYKRQALNVEEMKVWNPSVPLWLFTDDFIRCFQDVLRIRRSVILHRWQTFFDTCYKKMLSSHEMYMTFVMFACHKEHKCNQNIFESFVSVFALVKLICDETLQKTGVNFCDFNSDIFMVFYRRSMLQSTFCRRGGFPRLAEYIRNHRYLKWKLNKDYNILPDDTSIVIAIENEKLQKELKRELIIDIETNPDDAARDTTSRDFASTVIRIALIKLPTLPSYPDLLKNVKAYTEKKMAKNADGKIRTEEAEKLEAIKEALQGCSSLNYKSISDYIGKHQDNVGQYENIIQAVIKRNHSKSSSNESPNNQIQEEAEGVLEHLKDKIKSLIDVLDECDKE